MMRVKKAESQTPSLLCYLLTQVSDFEKNNKNTSVDV
jgi:hypothetical protein